MGDDPKWRSRAEFQCSASATDPNPNPYQQTPSPSMSSQLATGVWHPSYLLKPNLQAKDSCCRKAVLPVSDTSVLPLYAKPGGRAFRRSVLTVLYQHWVEPCWKWHCALRVKMHTSKFHWGEIRVVKPRWKNGKGRGHFFARYFNVMWRIWDGEKDEYKKGQRENKSNKMRE